MASNSITTTAFLLQRMAPMRRAACSHTPCPLIPGPRRPKDAARADDPRRPERHRKPEGARQRGRHHPADLPQVGGPRQRLRVGAVAGRFPPARTRTPSTGRRARHVGFSEASQLVEEIRGSGLGKEARGRKGVREGKGSGLVYRDTPARLSSQRAEPTPRSYRPRYVVLNPVRARDGRWSSYSETAGLRGLARGGLDALAVRRPRRVERDVVFASVLRRDGSRPPTMGRASGSDLSRLSCVPEAADEADRGSETGSKDPCAAASPCAALTCDRRA